MLFFLFFFIGDKVHVTFLADNGRVQWINVKKNLLHFNGIDEFFRTRDEMKLSSVCITINAKLVSI